MASSSTSQAKGGRRDGKSNGKDGRAVGAENQSGTSFASAPPIRTPASNASPGNSPSHEAIARRAYELYEQEGRQPGREVEYWLRAEAELTS